MTTVRKYQIEKLMNKVSSMTGSTIQYHNLAKVWNANRERYSWQVTYYNKNGNYNTRYIGDTLAECLEYFTLEEQDALWREEQQAKWEAQEAS